MLSLSAIGFTAPWILTALLALPVLWFILRAIPPAPVRRRFPAVTLLLGLRDDDHVSDRTPWWLLLLRMLALAAVILGLAGPVLNPRAELASRSGPLLVVMDAGWASGTDWAARQDAVQSALADAQRDSRPVAFVRLSDPEAPIFQSADTWRDRIAGLAPEPWAPREQDVKRLVEELEAIGDFDTLWVSDGLARESRAPLLELAVQRGSVRVIETGRPVLALPPPAIEDGALVIAARRSLAGAPRSIRVIAHGTDPAGRPAPLADVVLSFGEGESRAQARLDLPSELRARITRLEIAGERHAGAVAIPDDSLRRREVALFAGPTGREGLELLSPLHYLEKALEPSTNLIKGEILDALPANPDVVILADVATLTGEESEALTKWVEKGGMLVRFAGPRLAASDISRAEEDPLMPVRLRRGGRTVGGAMSWGEPKALAPFPENSPFYGLKIPDDVRVSAQVMAQPDPTLSERVIASLSDGTPLVTRKSVGKGQVILFHVTANAEWSTLPLSGLFVSMLERLAISTAVATPAPEELTGTLWKPVRVLDGFGGLRGAENLPGVPGEALVSAPLGPELRPGLYQSGDRTLARAVVSGDTPLGPMLWPATVTVEGLDLPQEVALAGWMLAAALALLALDVVASLWLSGRLGAVSRAAVLLAALLPLAPDASRAQSGDADEFTIEATRELHLAYVRTGNAEVDRIAEAGLRGLSQTLFLRTSVEPEAPIGVDIEQDELAFFPLLYWPVTPDQPLPSKEAYHKLNTFLRTGGMILFDTRDADIAGFGPSSPNGRRLQQIARGLDIPPLEPIPDDHVLTRTFYLLQDFPGRHASREVWVEAAPPDAERIEGMPFRNLNDNVTPVIIGGNDWAAAWAIDASGRPMFPVGRGYAGERQRELARRFGVNLVMYVLTGNYKSDQVHVPALLERLGQ